MRLSTCAQRSRRAASGSRSTRRETRRSAPPCAATSPARSGTASAHRAISCSARRSSSPTGRSRARAARSSRTSPATTSPVLVCGSEGRLALIGRASFRLHPLPTASATLVVETDDAAGVGRAAARALSSSRARSTSSIPVAWPCSSRAAQRRRGPARRRASSSAARTADDVGLGRVTGSSGRRARPRALHARRARRPRWPSTRRSCDRPQGSRTLRAQCELQAATRADRRPRPVGRIKDELDPHAVVTRRSHVCTRAWDTSGAVVIREYVRLRALRLLPADVPDVRPLERGDGLASRAHSPHGRPPRRRHRAEPDRHPAFRPLPRLHGVRVVVPVGGSLRPAHREHAGGGGGRGRAAVGRSLVRGLLFRLLPYPGRMRAALALAPIGRALPMPRRLRPLVDIAPRWRGHGDVPTVTPAAGTRRARVGLLTGCVQRAVFPDVNAATARVLAADGFEVVAPPQGCCGALSVHAGRPRGGEGIRAARSSTRSRDVDLVVVNSSGCGSHLKELGWLLGDERAGVILRERPRRGRAARQRRAARNSPPSR